MTGEAGQECMLLPSVLLEGRKERAPQSAAYSVMQIRLDINQKHFHRVFMPKANTKCCLTASDILQVQCKEGIH